MKLKLIGSNQTELILKDGTQVFFSYETAVCVRNADGCFVTEEKYSNTTTRHINKWCDFLKRTSVSQNRIDNFIHGVII